MKFVTKPVVEEQATAVFTSWLSTDGEYKVTRVESKFKREPFKYAALRRSGKTYDIIGRDTLGPGYPKYHKTLSLAIESIENVARDKVENRDKIEEPSLQNSEQETKMESAPALETKKMKVSRDDAIAVLKAVGIKIDPDKYDNKELANKLRKLPGQELAEVKDKRLNELLDDIMKAVEDDEAVLVKGTTTNEEAEETSKPKAKSKAKDDSNEEEDTPKAKASSNGVHKIVITKKWIEDSRETESVTPELAEEFRDMERFPHDRNATKARRDFLKSRILAGEWQGNVWASVDVKDTNTRYRMNGFGSSSTFCDLFDDGYKLDAVVEVRRYSCKTMRDAADLYATFDPKASARTKANLIQTYAAGSKKLNEVRGPVIKLAAAGLGFFTFERDYRKRGVEQQAELLLDNDAFVVWLSKTLDIKRADAPHVFRMPVVAAMAATYSKSNKEATDFWEAIRDDSDDPKTDPKRILRNWLLTHNFGAKSENTEKDIASDREGYVICLQAWNAWKKGDKTWKPKYSQKMETPKVQ